MIHRSNNSSHIPEPYPRVKGLGLGFWHHPLNAGRPLPEKPKVDPAMIAQELAVLERADRATKSLAVLEKVGRTREDWPGESLMDNSSFFLPSKDRLKH